MVVVDKIVEGEMKTFCPNCEREAETHFVAEIRECEECGSEYEVANASELTALRAENARLLWDVTREGAG